MWETVEQTFAMEALGRGGGKIRAEVTERVLNNFRPVEEGEVFTGFIIGNSPKKTHINRATRRAAVGSSLFGTLF